MSHLLRLTQAAEMFGRGDRRGAENACRNVLLTHPDDVDALHLLALVANADGDQVRSCGLLNRAISLAPTVAQLHSNLAAVLRSLGRHSEALIHAADAVRLDPQAPAAHNNHGVAMEEKGQVTEAAAAYRAAIALQPDYAEAHHNLGKALWKLARFDESIAAHQTAIRCGRGHPSAYGGIARSLTELGRLDEMIAARRAQVAAAPGSAVAHSALLYALHYHPGQDRTTLFNEHHEWDRRHGLSRAAHALTHSNDRMPGRRIRVGFVSPDLWQHTVTRFAGAAIERLNRDAFDVYCYSDTVIADHVTARLKASSSGWRDTRRLSDERLAAVVREDRIDVLVDLRGHGADNRLPVFAMKPAPVQVSMVGYFDTTGLSAMDYRLTDGVQDPGPSADAFHCERLIRLPHGCWCYQPDGDEPPVGPLPLLRNGHVTFGCLNKLIKVTPEVASVWTRILESVPRSRLTLASRDAGAAAKRLAKTGLPSDRVDVLGKVSGRHDYLDRFNRIDVALDTFPFNGITTTCDGLWMGVPAVTLCGQTSVGRAGASIMTSLGLPELASGDIDRYVESAVAMASDANRLDSLRRSLRDRFSSSPLGDSARFVTSFEVALHRMWGAWCSR